MSNTTGLKGNSKADKVEYKKRIRDVATRLLRGEKIQNVAIDIQDKYDITESQAYRYTSEATKQVHAKIDGSLEDRINKHFQMLELLYNECISRKDYSTARATLKDISQLLGYDAPKRQDITSLGEKINVALVKFEDGNDRDKTS